MSYKKIAVYGVHNITLDKWYIGSSIDVENRLNMHIEAVKNKTGVFKDIQESDDFEFKILKELKNNNTLEKWENYFIGFYNSIENGYNNILASRRPIVNVVEYKVNNSDICILNDNDLSELLKIDCDEELEDLKQKIPYLLIGKKSKRYDKLSVINFLIKEGEIYRNENKNG